ncbi:MAG: class I SAM-dependent methyltransferase [Candidatus Woesearchaeota archaeon]
MEHYYSAKQHSTLKPYTISFDIDGIHLSYVSASGLFSAKHLDTATQLLMSTSQVYGHVADLGCGSGVVGLFLKKKFPSITLTALDISERAIEITKQNFKTHHVKATVICTSLFDGVQQHFDCIVTNPPYVAGRQTCLAFIEQSYAHLRPKGTLFLVARHQKGGKVLKQHMQHCFGNVETLAKSGGFHVYVSVRKN